MSAITNRETRAECNASHIEIPLRIICSAIAQLSRVLPGKVEILKWDQ
jgi:hypothetical protein